MPLPSRFFRQRFAQERERRRLEATSAEGSGAQGSESMAAEGPANSVAASGGGERGPRTSPLFDAFSDSGKASLRRHARAGVLNSCPLPLLPLSRAVMTLPA